jgi:glycosyltransferase involved in cell wall biosynthesis
MYTLEVLIATMFRENQEAIIGLLEEMNISSDCVVVNQCEKDEIEYFDYKNHTIKTIYSTERGLSKSRNLAILNSKADIIVIADDDYHYVDNYSEIIIGAYNSHPDKDILMFDVNVERKVKEKKFNRISINAVPSCRITMKLASVKNNKFDTFFGTGSSYFSHGEETIFLHECIKKGCMTCNIPLKIVSITLNRPSTWFTGYNKKYLIDQGALYYRLYHFLAIFFVAVFLLRKYKLYRVNTNIFFAMYYMLCGIKEYKQLHAY